MTFEDGSTKTLHWSGLEGMRVFEFVGESKVVSAQVDPQQRLWLDVDLNNNSLTLEPAKSPLWKYAAKAVYGLYPSGLRRPGNGVFYRRCTAQCRG